MTKNEIATIEDNSVLPAYLQGSQVVNDDNFDDSDVVLPRIKLLQGTSPEVEAYETAKNGDFWHTGLDISLGSEFRFIVADRRKKYLLSAPLNDGQGILARSDDAITWDRLGKWEVKLKNIKKPVTWEITSLNIDESGLAKWGTMNPDDEDSPPAATLFYDYLVYLPDHPDLGMSVMSLARSQIKPARKGLNDKIKMHADNRRPMQALMFTAKSVEEISADGPYKNWAFRSAGFVQDESLFNMLVEYRGALGRYVIKDEADVGDGDGSGSGGDDGEGKF